MCIEGKNPESTFRDRLPHLEKSCNEKHSSNDETACFHPKSENAIKGAPGPVICPHGTIPEENKDTFAPYFDAKVHDARDKDGSHPVATHIDPPLRVGKCLGVRTINHKE